MNSPRTARMIGGVFTLLLAACGGGGGPWSGNNSTGGAPSAVTETAANAGDGAVSLGWTAPTSGSAPFTYTVTINPSSAQSAISYSGTTALVRGLSNNT